jgi:putative N6-adenine-specific DNA methylase
MSRIDYDTLVVTAPGLEQVTQNELAKLGVVPKEVLEPGAIPVHVAAETLYTMNLNLRTASRITVRVTAFHARSFAELERRAKVVSWDEWLGKDIRVRLRVTCRKSRLYHSDAVAERIASAIVGRTSARIDADADDEGDGQLILVRLLRDECTIRIDSSGDNLHRRGYRQAIAKAPLRETLAAAMLMGAEWSSEAPLIDPFCGSGTIPIEAALIARNIAPGIQRSFAFQQWPSFSEKQWRQVVDRARAAEQPRNALIFGADRDQGAIDAARANAVRAGVADHIEFKCQPLSALTPPATTGWLVTNPPYGVRVGERDRLRNLYATLGRLARDRLPGWHIALLSAHPALEAQLAVPLTEGFRTTNGGLNVRLVQRLPFAQRQVPGSTSTR